MQFSLFQVASVAAFFGLSAAAPADAVLQSNTLVSRAQFTCDKLVAGLNKADCEHMAKIGMKAQGKNSKSNKDKIWIGGDGKNTFKFTNSASKPSNAPVTLVLWYNAPNDYQSSFMNVRQAHITYSLPKVGDSVTISLDNGVSGGWSTLVNEATTLSQYGQIYNTWGEFTTGGYATVDVSREVNMGGNTMSVRVAANGCTSNMDKCVFKCKSGNTCGAKDTYNLVDCANGSQPGATYGTRDGQPEGGCQGWTNGGHLDIKLGRK